MHRPTLGMTCVQSVRESPPGHRRVRTAQARRARPAERCGERGGGRRAHPVGVAAVDLLPDGVDRVLAEVSRLDADRVLQGGAWEGQLASGDEPTREGGAVEEGGGRGAHFLDAEGEHGYRERAAPVGSSAQA